MRSRLLAAGLFAALMLVLALFLSTRRTRDHVVESTSSSGREVVSQNEITRSGSSGRQAIPSATPDRPDVLDRTVRLLAELRGLEPLMQTWPPNQGQHDFLSVDMHPLKERVLALGLTGAEVATLLETSRDDATLQPLLLAAVAFVPDVNEATKDLVATIVREKIPRVDPGDGSPPGLVAAACYAGVFALQMGDADLQTQAVALDLLRDYDATRQRGTVRRDVAAMTVVDLGKTASPELVEAMKRVLAGPGEMGLTSALYKGISQAGSSTNVEDVLRLARAQNGHAREGLEEMRDPGRVRDLADLCTTGELPMAERASANYLAGSAARGLLAIGTPESAAAFQRLALSADPGPASAAARALELSPPPEAAGILAKTAAAARRAGNPIGSALTMAMHTSMERLLRCTVPVDDARRCARGVREILPDIVDDHEVMQAALEVLAVSGGPEDQADFQRFTSELSEPHQAAVRALWDKAHPPGAH